MPTTRDVHQLLEEARKAPTGAEQARLVSAAEQAKVQIRREAQRDREVDLSQAIVTEHLTPVSVHEHHTAATDWLSEIDTSGGEKFDHDLVAQGSLWYSNLSDVVKSYPEEFAEQARGRARKLAGSYGEQSDSAESTFLSHVATLHERDVRSGTVKVAADLTPQVGEEPGSLPTENFPTGSGYEGLPGDVTSSERAPAIQQLENNGANNEGGTDVTPINDPGLGHADPSADQGNGDVGTTQVADLGKQSSRTAADTSSWPKCSVCGKPVSPVEMAMGGTDAPTHTKCIGRNKKESGMRQALVNCPTCGGHGKTAALVPDRQPSITEIIGGNQRLAYSGLPQVDQVVDPSDTNVSPTPYPAEVAFPWMMNSGNVQNTIQTAEQQIAEREQRKGASLERTARATGNQAYTNFVQQMLTQYDPGMNYDPRGRHASLHVKATEYARNVYSHTKQAAGYDDSGWLGDMGAGGYGAGEQDFNGGGGPSNLGQPDDVYGYGGDQQSRPLKPYGADEADDETNKPSMWQPGQPTQMDLAGGGERTQGQPGPAFPNPPINGSK